MGGQEEHMTTQMLGTQRRGWGFLLSDTLGRADESVMLPEAMG